MQLIATLVPSCPKAMYAISSIVASCPARPQNPFQYFCIANSFSFFLAFLMSVLCKVGPLTASAVTKKTQTEPKTQYLVDDSYLEMNVFDPIIYAVDDPHLPYPLSCTQE